MTQEFKEIVYDEPAPGVARITMNRPEQRNAQGLTMTYELNAAFDRAAHDDAVKVIILAGVEPHFSSGHDLGGDRSVSLKDFETIGTWGGFEAGGTEGRFGREKEVYLEVTERWRNLPKPTIAQVQGKCIAGGLMLAWCCDLIVASDDAQFQDPTPNFGVCGVEFFMHPWEIGTRKAKEWLFTTDWLTASQARELGMVNQVIPRAELADKTLELATRIAEKPMFALKTVKEAINHIEDLQGRRHGMQHVFGLHHLCHAHNQMVYGIPMDPHGLPKAARDAYLSKVKPASDAAE